MTTKGEWTITVHRPLGNLRIVIKSEHSYDDNDIATIEECLESKANANLIVSAVNACQKINPDNPQAVAEAIPEMYEALRKLVKTYVMNQASDGTFPAPAEFIACITPKHGVKNRPKYWNDAIVALSKAEGK